MLKHDYKDHLSSFFYAPIEQREWIDPRVLLVNEEIEKALQIHELTGPLATGKEFYPGTEPIAMAYAGHQFGYYTMLGDGRAFLLGEIEKDGVLYDIHCKGGGRTKFSRGGDGQATLGAMLREFIVSEAMHALGVPTTRTLAIATTGNTVYRETAQIGATLLRVAKSHIRVGTFEYAAYEGSREKVREFFEYTLKRHAPHLIGNEDRVLCFFEYVVMEQMKLMVHWMTLGFIHGVMNTDNMAMSGETIDYGPCAFMEAYHPDTVFSSIDHGGRYAYQNQPQIALWNLARFAQTLLTMDTPEAHDFERILLRGKSFYDTLYWETMGKKLGLSQMGEDERELIRSFLDHLQENEMDYTNAFVSIMDEDFAGFDEDWVKQLKEKQSEESKSLMAEVNPRIIPRNHLVEKAIADGEKGEFEFLLRFVEALKSPYSTNVPREFTHPMEKEKYHSYKTYCGT